MKQLEKLQKVEIDAPAATAKIRFPRQERKKGTAVEVKDLVIGYPNKRVAGPVNITLERGKRVGVLGDNGQGKSTFLKTLAESLSPLSGTVKWGHGTQIGYFAQHVYEELNQPFSVVQYLEREADVSVTKQQVMDTAGSLLFSGDDMHKPLSVLSGGERARVLLARIILSNPTVMLLDEPTNHLDFETVELLAAGLREYSGTVFFISHDRTFIRQVATGVVHVSEGQIRNFPGPFDEFVYYLQGIIAAESQVDAPAPVAKVTAPKGPSSAKERRELTKTAAMLENKIAKLEKEKAELTRFFATDPIGVSDEKSARLKFVETEIKRCEAEWVTVDNRLNGDD